MGGIKNIRATSEAVTLLRALTGDVYAVADALHWLSTEDQHRRIRLDEVRVSLAALDSNRLLPDAPPTLSKAVATLLRTTSPLTQTELAEQADVSSRSIGRHIDGLVALDIVRLTDEGLRLALPFGDGDERGERILPAAVDEGATVVQELAFDVASVLLDDSSRLGNLDDPVGAAFVWPPDFEALRTHLPAINPYLRIAKALSNAPESPTTTVEFGATVQQMSLQASASERSLG
jgi:hypothetical protein